MVVFDVGVEWGEIVIGKIWLAASKGPFHKSKLVFVTKTHTLQGNPVGGKLTNHRDNHVEPSSTKHYPQLPQTTKLPDHSKPQQYI